MRVERKCGKMERGKKKKSSGEQRERSVRPWETGWSATSPGRGDHTHTSLCAANPCMWMDTLAYTVHTTLHRIKPFIYWCVCLKMLLVGELSIILQHHWRKTAEWDAWRGGREGGRKSLSVKQLAACCFQLASSYHLSGGEVGVEDTHWILTREKALILLSLSLYILLSLLSFLLPSIPNFPSSSPPASCCPCRAHLSVHLTLPSVHLYILYALGTTPCPKWQSILHQRGARTKKKKRKRNCRQLCDEIKWKNEVKLKEIRNGETLK